MEGTKDITIVFGKGQVLTDVSAQCAALARTIELSSISGKAEEAESVRLLAGYINSPSDNVIRPIVARAFTEAYDQVKSVCQRYLKLGRTEDDNRLESIIEGEVITVYKGTPTQSGNLGGFTPEAGVKYKVSVEGIGAAEMSVTIQYQGATVATLNNSESTCEIEGVFNGGTVSCMTDIHIAPTNEIVVTADSTAFAEMVLELGMPSNFNIGVTSTIKSTSHKIFVDYILSQVLRFQRPQDSTALLEAVEWSKGLLLKALSARETFTRSHQDWG